jgi:mandelate racemase
MGENFAGVRTMKEALDRGACDLVMPDLDRIGGVSGWMAAAALADAHRIELSSHLFPEVSAHLLAASPTSHWLEYVDWADALVEEPLKVRDGALTASTRPGSGISWNRDAVRRYAVTD